MNCTEFNSRDLDPFINNDRPASYKAAGHRSRNSQTATSTRRLLLHSNPHIARAITLSAATFKQKEIGGGYIPPMSGLLTEK